jgi:hypothetical protein
MSRVGMDPAPPQLTSLERADLATAVDDDCKSSMHKTSQSCGVSTPASVSTSRRRLRRRTLLCKLQQRPNGGPPANCNRPPSTPRARAEAAEAAASAAEKRLADVYDSHTWRWGRRIVAGPGVLKRLARGRRA